MCPVSMVYTNIETSRRLITVEPYCFEVLVFLGEVKQKVIPWEVGGKMKLSKEQKSILVGIILGDGYLQRTGKKNSRLRLEHGAKQAQYLIWKTNLLKPLFNGKPNYLKRVHPINKKTYFYVRHQSNSSRLLGKFGEKFYKNGIKTIPDDLAKILTSPLSLAVWFMDDGYYYQRDRCGYLYLGNVSRNEAEIVKQVLLDNFLVKTRVLKKKKGFAIYFSPSEMVELKKVIEPFLLEDFKYKIPLDPVSTDSLNG